MQKNLQELIDAGRQVIDRWESGDLAGAVNNLDGTIDAIEAEEKTAEKKEAAAKRKPSLWNPDNWQDPDMVGQSEYRAILDHAETVWASSPSEPARERASLLRSSLVEMQEWIETILREGPPQKD